MKTVITSLLFVVFGLTTGLTVHAQCDDQLCKDNYSIFKENAKQGAWDYAAPAYQYLITNCNTCWFNIYFYGQKMWEYRIKNAKDETTKQLYVDSLLMMHQIRKEAAKTNQDVIGKSEDKQILALSQTAIVLYENRPDQTENIIKETQALIDEFKENNLAYIYYIHMTMVVRKKDAGEMDCEGVIDVYNQLSEYVDINLDKYAFEQDSIDANTQFEKGQKVEMKDGEGNTLTADKYPSRLGNDKIFVLYNAEGVMFKKVDEEGYTYNSKTDFYLVAQDEINKAAGPCLSCETLVEIFRKGFDAKKDDAKWVKKAVDALDRKKCYKDEKYHTDEFIFNIYIKNAELNPTADAYKKAGVICLIFKKSDEAVTYFDKAVSLTAEDEKKAELLMLMASLEADNGNYSQARKYALKAASYKKNWGKPYIFIGDLYAGSMNKVSAPDDCTKRGVFWAAADKYAYAKSIDPSVTEKANRKIGIVAANYPDQSACFFNGYKDGQSYTVGGWIGETTTIRIRK